MRDYSEAKLANGSKWIVAKDQRKMSCSGVGRGKRKEGETERESTLGGSGNAPRYTTR